MCAASGSADATGPAPSGFLVVQTVMCLVTSGLAQMSVVIVSPQPTGCKILDLIECVEHMVGQPVGTYRAVIAIDIGVLLRLARLGKVDAYSALCGLGRGHRADLLRTVIATNDQWLAAPFDNPVERSNHPVRG